MARILAKSSCSDSVGPKLKRLGLANIARHRFIDEGIEARRSHYLQHLPHVIRLWSDVPLRETEWIERSRRHSHVH